jgi:hypothetical protein
MRCKSFSIMVLSFSLILYPAAFVLPEQFSDMKVVPASVEIGTFYFGQEIRGCGSVLQDQDVIVEVKGPGERSIFKVKGRVGPFWMNRETVELENAPFLYIMLLPKGRKWEASLSSLGVGMARLKRGLIIKNNTLSDNTIFDRFVQLKESEHLYGVKDGGVVYSKGKDGRKYFEAKFRLPPSAIPGGYKIVATLVSDGRVEERASQSFMVEEVGFIKGVHELAFHRALAYGILCVVVALFVGALMGLFFRRARAH